MDGRVREVNRVVRGYDKYLYAQRESNGAIHIYRRNSHQPSSPHFIMAITTNWVAGSPPRDWGLEVIRARLIAMDLWKEETVVDRIEAARGKRDESEKRDLHNTVESFLYDFRKQFARATNDINTGTLDRKIDARRQYEKRVHAR